MFSYEIFCKNIKCYASKLRKSEMKYLFLPIKGMIKNRKIKRRKDEKRWNFIMRMQE